MKPLTILITVFLTLLPLLATAQEREFDMRTLNQEMGTLTTDDTNFAAVNSDIGGGRQDGIEVVILRIIGSLAIVLALVAGTATIIRKTGLFRQSGINAASQTPSMSVLEALSTGLNGAVLLIRCEEQVFLVGQTQSNYTFLQELNSDTARKIIESKAGNETITSFKTSLANFMQNIKVQKSGQPL